MTIKEYNEEFFPSIERAECFICRIESAVNHASISENDKKEVMRNLEIRNWDKETKDTILKALDFYREAVLKQALAELEEAML